MKLHEEISELEQRFAESPDSRLFLPLADALRRAGELERAVKLCRDGLERFPDFSSARVLLGECLADMGELDEAEGVLRESAQYDDGNRRIADRLAEIARQGSGGIEDMPTADGRDETAVADAGSPEAEPADEAAVPQGTHSAGEMFITHTLGDIYKMQGHERKAYEIYSKLKAEGKSDPEIEGKLRELAERLGERIPGGVKAEAGAGDGVAVAELARAGGGGGRFEERIDTIFHFLLGDSPEHTELDHLAGGSVRTAAPGGSGEFVDMLEEWIDDIRQGK